MRRRWIGGIMAAILVLAGSGAARAAAQEDSRPVSESAIRQAIDRGVAFLAQQQLPSGEFPVDVQQGADETWQLDSTVFGTALLLYSLRAVSEHRVEGMITRGLAFVESQQESNGLWRYWAPGRGDRPLLPPDADDTSVSAVALILNGHSARADMKEFLRHRDAEGRLLTWFVERVDDDPAQISAEVKPVSAPDCVVNANALGFAALRKVELPQVCTWLAEQVQANASSRCTLFYASPHALGYALMKAHTLGASCIADSEPVLREQLEQSQHEDGSWGTMLDSALALTTAGHLGVSQERQRRAVSFLLAHQGRDGSWPREVFYTEPRDNPVSRRFGSSALTTGLVLEALGRYVAASHRGTTQVERGP